MKVLLDCGCYLRQTVTSWICGYIHHVTVKIRLAFGMIIIQMKYDRTLSGSWLDCKNALCKCDNTHKKHANWFIIWTRKEHPFDSRRKLIINVHYYYCISSVDNFYVHFICAYNMTWLFYLENFGVSIHWMYPVVIQFSGIWIVLHFLLSIHTV